MVASQNTIDNIIKNSKKDVSEQEAKKILRACGVLNKQNEVKEAYRSIFVRANTPLGRND